MNTTSIGYRAERVAKKWLETRGYAILQQNWKTRWCEIDIVAKKQGVVYFVEVRHRRTSTWGDGLDSITSKKYKQVEFGANFWMHQNHWQGDARIVVIATSGDPPQVVAATEL